MNLYSFLGMNSLNNLFSFKRMWKLIIDKKRYFFEEHLQTKILLLFLIVKTKESLCPVFQLKYIVDQAEPSIKEQFDMLSKGAVILIEINWSCNLDTTDICIPNYSFRRFDSKESNAATGFNFR